MYPYIIMKLSKKKIQKLYKSKNQTRKSGGKKSFKPKQTNHRSRKAGALNLRRRTLRKMKGGDPGGEGGEEQEVEATPVLTGESVEVEKTPVKVPEGGIEFTPEDLKEVFEKYTEGNPNDNTPTPQGQIMGEQKEVSFKDLNTYKRFMTDVANLILKKLNEVYDKKMKKMKEELLKKIEGEKKPVASEVYNSADVKKDEETNKGVVNTGANDATGATDAVTVEGDDETNTGKGSSDEGKPNDPAPREEE